MTSKAARDGQAFVWTYLPGDQQPTLCGRFRHEVTAAGEVGSFEYASSYLANKDGQPIDPFVLPLRPIEFKATKQAGFFGVFVDAAPDSWGRGVINLLYGKPASPVGYLLQSLGDRVGNLAFSASPDQVPAEAPIPGRKILPKAFAVLRGIEGGRPEDPALEHFVRPNTSMGGARPKLTVVDGGFQWIAKFPARGDDPLVSVARLEHAMHDLARQCDIDAVHSELVKIGRNDVLLVRRFDRTAVLADGQPVGWLRDAFVSARTVLASSGVTTSFTGSYPNLARELSRWSAKPAEDKRQLFRRMVFNCLVSNSDDHDRNHGFLADEGGNGFRLSPAYDMVPRVPTTVKRVQAMVVGEDASPTRDNILSHCDAFGLVRADAQGIYEQIAGVVRARWRDSLQGSGISAKAIERLAPCFAASDPPPRRQRAPKASPPAVDPEPGSRPSGG